MSALIEWLYLFLNINLSEVMKLFKGAFDYISSHVVKLNTILDLHSTDFLNVKGSESNLVLYRHLGLASCLGIAFQQSSTEV